jgi:hypothetical protein
MSGDPGAYWKSVSPGGGFRVQAIARAPRHQAIALVEEAVQRHGGDILDFKMFSNLSLAMIIEMTGSGVLALVASLVALGWQAEVEPASDSLAGRGEDRLGSTLQVTFPEGDGELAIPQPAVPG